MREILFRGKRKENGRWIYGSLVPKETNSYADGFLIIDGALNYDELDDYQPSFSTYDVVSETVGQYTGLTDKNGKKIFEGDIVKREYTLWHSETKKTRETQIGVVSYSNKECGFHLDKVCNLRKQWDGDTLEIIGNIHDNKLEDF